LAYLIHVYWSRDKDWVGRRQFDRRLEWHRGSAIGANAVQWDADEQRFYVIWSVGLAEGSKYDVKSFKIRFRYWGLRGPLQQRVEGAPLRGHATDGRTDLRYSDVR